MTEDSKDGYIIDFKKNKFTEIKEPYAFSKTSFYTPGAWVDDNFLVPKPGASGEGDLYIGKLDTGKGEIEFTEINKSEKKFGYWVGLVNEGEGWWGITAINLFFYS